MIPRFERIRFLRRVPLFQSLPGEDLVSVASVLEELELEDGEVVFRRGDRGEDLFVVVLGTVEIGDAEHVLARLGETEFFGDLAVLDHEGRSADATARGATKLLRLRGADLRELMATRPEITQGVVRVLVARLRDASGKLSS
jgi:CRP-like cAMP-binding protein